MAVANYNDNDFYFIVCELKLYSDIDYINNNNEEI